MMIRLLPAMNTAEPSTSSDPDRMPDQNVEVSVATLDSGTKPESESEDNVAAESISEKTAESEPSLPLTRVARAGRGRSRIVPWTLGLLVVGIGVLLSWKDVPPAFFRTRKAFVSEALSVARPSQAVAPLTHSAPAAALSGPLNLPREAALDSVRLASKRDFTAIELQLNRPVDVHAVRLVNPDRVYFDLASTHLGAGWNVPADASRELEVQDGLIRRIRVAQREPDVARIVLDLKCSCEFSYVMSPHPPYRLVIDVQPPM